MPSFKHLSLEELWTQTLQELDILHDRFDCNRSGLSATERNTVMQSLAGLRSQGPLADDADDHVGRIETHLRMPLTGRHLASAMSLMAMTIQSLDPWGRSSRFRFCRSTGVQSMNFDRLSG
ncbi:hypothetical protein C4N9_06235 [Pararhodobacter marinus]|uniref:Uncharacterized protein n=1 Tax=Pararhodobacter marinus TaxID=2184063 RepID=A0A2U2CES8_9RHOB|nr:hypothetical protein C4N9_06235 [Pararhodobacter marinus]